MANEEIIMARITVEDCLKNVDNRFALIHLAAKRVRQLRKGAEPLVVCKNKDIVVSLREIAANRIFQADPNQVNETESIEMAGELEAPSEELSETADVEKEEPDPEE
jgi:DNA-directed RNA polymerase subunit omega